VASRVTIRCGAAIYKVSFVTIVTKKNEKRREESGASIILIREALGFGQTVGTRAISNESSARKG
jgi:hypothetical protein